MRVLGLLFVLVLGSSATAQDFTARYDTRGPRFIYGTYTTSSGEVGSVSYNRVGRFTYGYFSDGSRSTTTQVGRRIYTDIWINR
jgi:hypothetical protein